MKKLAILTGIFFVLFSCNSGNNESSETSSDRNMVKVSSKGSGETYDCLKKFQDDYSGLLSKEEITSVYPVDFNVAEKELRSGSYGEYIYRWPSDRPSFTKEISGMKMEIPDQNTIGIKMLSFSSDKRELKSIRETYDMGYKKLSDKELEKIQNNLDKQDEEVKKTGKDLMKVRAKRNWDFVEGLGTSSWYKWNDNYGGELAVLAERANFYIVIKTSNDSEANRNLAVKLAEMVLAKCD